jgi:hypothetical protein
MALTILLRQAIALKVTEDLALEALAAIAKSAPVSELLGPGRSQLFKAVKAAASGDPMAMPAGTKIADLCAIVGSGRKRRLQSSQNRQWFLRYL